MKFKLPISFIFVGQTTQIICSRAGEQKEGVREAGRHKAGGVREWGNEEMRKWGSVVGGGTRWIGASKERLESGARTTKKECKQQQKKKKE